MKLAKRPAVFAAALSFLVYVIPLLGPHTFTMLGPSLIREWTHERNRGAVWIATDLGMTLLLQGIAFLLFYWFLRKPALVRGLLLAGTIPAFTGIVGVSYLVAIPSMFLIEDDTQPESGDGWTSICDAENSNLISIPMSPVRTREVFEFPTQSADGNYQLMLGRCELTSLALPRPTLQNGRVDFTLSPHFIVPGIGILFQRIETSTGTVRWGLLRTKIKEPVDIEVPSTSVVLSTDGEWIAWIQSDEGSGPRPSRVFVRRVSEERASLQIDLSEYGVANSYDLMSLDAQKKEVLIARNDYSSYAFKTIDFDGVQRESIEPDGVDPQSQTFLKLTDGWVAWDAYQERDPYRVRWSLPGGSGTHRVLLGRGITSVAVNPGGTMIAISVTTALNIGSIRDAVYILRADGTEIFRRYLPRYSRSPVLFSGDKRFVYSSDGRTHILEIP